MQSDVNLSRVHHFLCNDIFILAIEVDDSTETFCELLLAVFGLLQWELKKNSGGGDEMDEKKDKFMEICSLMRSDNRR